MRDPASEEHGFRVRPASWPEDEPPVRALRSTVFVGEQKVPREIEQDGRDPECLHVLAESGAGETIGTARLLPSGQIGRMAVARPWRRRGVGRALLDVLLDLARARGFERVFLHAQRSALPFYAKYGFEAVGDEFLEAGIVHRKMVMALPRRETGAPEAEPEERSSAPRPGSQT